MRLYDRIYYTIYRMVLKLANIFDMERETPRTEAVLVLSLLTAFNIIPIIFLVSSFTKEPVFSGKKISIMIMLLPVVLLNFLLIFYRDRYKDIEERLSAKWDEEKRRNIIITLLYILFTAVFLLAALKYISGRGVEKHSL
jgi:uncharacterized membrane protein